MENMKDVADKVINSSSVEYVEIYEEALKNIFMKSVKGKDKFSFKSQEKLMSLLKEKREFGIEKYGENSFQTSLEKSVLSPVVEHLESEIVDAINYTLHAFFVSDMKGYERKYFSYIFDDLIEVYKTIQKIK